MDKLSVRFSVIIPTYNGERTLAELLRIFERTPAKCFIEIICIDSHSTDNTVSIIKKYQKKIPRLRLYSISKSSFNHGGTRNWGARISQGEFVLFLSQDVIPKSTKMFHYFLEDFSNRRVMAVYGKQQKDPKSPFIQQLEITRDFTVLDRYLDSSGTLLQSKFHKLNLYDSETFYLWYFLSNACACYRKSYILRNPFPRLAYGEDYVVGREIIQNGFIKIYDSRVQVNHAVKYGLFEHLKKEILSLEFHSDIVGKHKKINLISKIKMIDKYEGNQSKINLYGDLLAMYIIKSLAFILVRSKIHQLSRLIQKRLIRFYEFFIVSIIGIFS